MSQGVDVNRNFDIAFKIEEYYSTGYLNQRDRWAQPLVVTSTVPCPDSLPPPPGTTRRIPVEFGNQYRGSAAGSEAETKNVVSLMVNKNIQFFVDIHSVGPAILFPWSIHKTQNTDPKSNFKNTTLDHTRDPSSTPPVGAEWIPRATVERLAKAGGRMREGILHMSTPSAGALPSNQFDSRYSVHPGLELYPATGSADDFFFNRQYTFAADHTASLAPPLRFAYTIECGNELGENLFFPHFTGEFSKISEEVHLALWSLLAYAAAPYRDTTVTWPIKTLP